MVVLAIQDFIRDDAMTLGASLAFYTALSIAPLLVLVVWGLSLLGHYDQKSLVDEMNRVVGPEAGHSLEVVLESAERRPDVGKVAGLIGLGVLLFSASGVFGQLQHSLDVIWKVKPKPGRAIRDWLRARLLSLGMVGSIGFLLMVSLVASAFVSALTHHVAQQGTTILWTFDLAAPFVGYVILFALVFKLLPDARVAWRDVWAGSFSTAFLFTIGKSLIGFYLGRASVASAYGAAGSIVILLLWVYSSSLILLFGAELTQARAKLSGRRIEPDEHATARASAT